MSAGDKKLYGVGDVRGRVNCILLIGLWIMSKKIGGGGDGIVVDVKSGSGGFMKRVDDGEGVGDDLAC